jgi:UDP-N-acetylglucosamine 2-epimerase (non-hydrolysing)
MQKYLFIFGTRPEAIKMAPLILQAMQDSDAIQVEVCITAQHREMLDQVIQFFDLPVHYDLQLMKPNQSLFEITANGISGLKTVLEKSKPSLVFVQGDTTTAFVGALAAFYLQLKIVHIEAGLRSLNLSAPFPEEANRKFVSVVANYHMAPTLAAAENLKAENIQQHIYITGNTVIDALLIAREKITTTTNTKKNFSFLGEADKVILVTGHRRESFGDAFENICFALKTLALQHPRVQIVYPVHLNPNVQKPVQRILANIKNIHLLPPLEYPDLVWLLNRCDFVLTDSGGIQEEAPAFGKPVLVMREVTERKEGVEAGNALLVGSDKDKVIHFANELLTNASFYEYMSKAKNPYGDGTAASQILSILKSVHL